MSNTNAIARFASVVAQTRMNERSGRSPQTNKEVAYNSGVARAIRNKKQTESVSGKEMFVTSDGKKQLKLAFLILTYLYSQDDQKLSKRELKDIKEIIKVEAPEFSSDDLIEVYGFFKILPDANYVISYIADNGINDESFYSANDTVLENFRNKPIYLALLKDLRTKYKAMFN